MRNTGSHILVHSQAALVVRFAGRTGQELRDCSAEAHSVAAIGSCRQTEIRLRLCHGARRVGEQEKPARACVRNPDSPLPLYGEYLVNIG